jgi:hypothetical protein
LVVFVIIGYYVYGNHSYSYSLLFCDLIFQTTLSVTKAVSNSSSICSINLKARYLLRNESDSGLNRFLFVFSLMVYNSVYYSFSFFIKYDVIASILSKTSPSSSSSLSVPLIINSYF